MVFDGVGVKRGIVCWFLWHGLQEGNPKREGKVILVIVAAVRKVYRVNLRNSSETLAGKPWLPDC